MISEKNSVLLANLPWIRDGRQGVRAGSRWPHIKSSSEINYLPFPFFLAYSAALLEKNGISSLFIDAIAEELTPDEFFDRLSSRKISWLVAETSIPSFSDDLLLLKNIAAKGIGIILCGPNSQMWTSDFLERHPFVSFVLAGEYEFTLLELITALEGGSALSSVPGILYRQDGRTLRTLKRPPFDIDALPWPKRDGLPMKAYLDAPGGMPVPSAQMMASRGCPFKCGFCLWPQVIYQGHHYRARDVKDVIDEMEYLVREKGFRSVYFDDDTFNVGRDRMFAFCSEIRKRRMEKIPWAIMARPDLMDKDVLAAMKDAGLWAVKYGVESAEQFLVDSIGKNMDLKKAIEMILFTKSLGVRTHLTFTFGLPGETKETMDATIDLALRLDPFSVQFSVTTPFPGTTYYAELSNKGCIISKNFNEFDGHGSSVIALPSLSAVELSQAKTRAYAVWKEHEARRSGGTAMNKFLRHYEEKGFSYAFRRGVQFIKDGLK